MNRKIFYAGALTVLTAIGAFGQTVSPTPTPSPSPNITTGGQERLPTGSNFNGDLRTTAPTLETVLSEAAKQTANYQETFKNLLADERKTFERFDKNGGVKNQTVVESTFLVYQSGRNEKVSSELRSVTKVDGKPVPDSQKRSEQLLGELQKTTTLEKELEKLQKEGSRYDKTLEINGLTLSEAVVLSDNLRPYFDFQMTGTENLNGNEVYVVDYQQNKKSPYISLNSNNPNAGELSLNFRLDVPGALKNSDPLLRGKLWIDAKTFQVWREERELTVQSPSPVVLLTTTFEYQPSDYGILVPKQISLLSNVVRKNSGQYTAVKDTRVNFDYSKFRKTDVDVKIIDDDQ